MSAETREARRRGGRIVDAALVAAWTGTAAVAVGNLAFVTLDAMGSRLATTMLGFAVATVLCLLMAAGLVYLSRMLRRAQRSSEDLHQQNAHAKALVRELLVAETPRAAEGVSASAFAEDLVLTVCVGSDRTGDRIIERRSTRPRQPVGHRTLTLVHTYIAGGESEPAEIVPDLSVERDGVRADWLPLNVDGRGCVLFTPAQSGEQFSWTLAYDVPDGLWDPLRSAGLDVFRYDVRTVPVQHFEVQFVIDSRALAVFVQERNGRGSVTGHDQDPDGSWRVSWSAGDGVATRYEWDLRVAWPAEMTGRAAMPSAARA